MSIFSKNQQNTNSNAQPKKNHLKVILKDSSNTSAEVKIDSDSSLKSEKVYKKAVEKIMAQTGWVNGDYTLICEFSGEETGHDVNGITVVKNGDSYDITFQKDEEATTLLEAELASKKPEEVMPEPEEEFVESDNTDDIEEEPESTGGSTNLEDACDEDTDEEDGQEEIPEEESKGGNDDDELDDVTEPEKEVGYIPKYPATPVSRANHEKEDTEALATVVRPRSSEDITFVTSSLSERVLALAEEEENYIIPLESLVNSMSFKDYAALKNRTYGSEKVLRDKVNAFICRNTSFGSISEMELQDPNQAAFMLLSFENLPHVMSNLRVLLAVFPDMEERTVRTMNPKSFGLKGKWDDPYECLTE